MLVMVCVSLSSQVQGDGSSSIRNPIHGLQLAKRGASEGNSVRFGII